MSDPVVIMHRPPLKRVDFSPRRKPAEPSAVDIDCIGKFIEQDRIWRLLRQSAEGCNSVEGSAG